MDWNGLKYATIPPPFILADSFCLHFSCPSFFPMSLTKWKPSFYFQLSVIAAHFNLLFLLLSTISYSLCLPESLSLSVSIPLAVGFHHVTFVTKRWFYSYSEKLPKVIPHISPYPQKAFDQTPLVQSNKIASGFSGEYACVCAGRASAGFFCAAKLSRNKWG